MTNPVLNVALAASKEIVDNSDFVSLKHQLVNQVRTHKASTTSYLQSVSIEFAYNSSTYYVSINHLHDTPLEI